jgi:hypothetical protein
MGLVNMVYRRTINELMALACVATHNEVGVILDSKLPINACIVVNDVVYMPEDYVYKDKFSDRDIIATVIRAVTLCDVGNLDEYRDDLYLRK